ncbi:MAG TPA: metallopeptidase TldD-related protein [Candidatus Acidoferrum sp.]|nr:metallopeptidase TldD-related protein [Candidatus Acidoferrum sp.]
MTEKLRALAKLFVLVFLLRSLGMPRGLAQSKDWQASAQADPVLQAMRVELERSKTQLKLEAVAAPYYIEYRVIDDDEYSAQAAFGALGADLRSRFRFLRVVVRIGDYKQDSYFHQGEGSSNIMPLDDDPLALRHQLWIATDRAYKTAAESLTAKQSQLKQLTVDQPVDDFARAEPLQSIEPLAKLDFDPRPWNRMLEDASTLYKTDPQLESFESSLKFQAINRYFVNSEGTVVRSGQSYYEMNFVGRSQAADGMSLERDKGFVANTMTELPSAEAFLSAAKDLAGTLRTMRDASLVDEEYRGPVLFSPNASTTIFADLVGENVLGYKPELGKNGRTSKAFASSYKSRVLPDFLSVIDDPTLATYRDRPLLGKYEIDDEGVRARSVSVVENGMLTNYLIGRQPIRDFPTSNGHGRARIPNNPAGPSLGNLIVTSSEPLSAEAMKKKLIDLCQQRDLPYGYFVDSFGSKLAPRLIYKVWVKDGHQELVRGAIFGDLDTRSLRNNLIAAGDDFSVKNHLLNIPHSIVTPSILFDELEVKRANQSKEKLPEYPPPLVSKSASQQVSAAK